MIASRVHELREESNVEQNGLGIKKIGEHSLAKDRPVWRTLQALNGGERIRLTHKLDSQVDEVEGASELDHQERFGRSLQKSCKAEDGEQSV